MAMQKTSQTPARIPPVPPQIVKPKAVLTPPQTKVHSASKPYLNIGALPFWAGLVLSVAWAAIVFAIVAGSGPTHVFGGLPLVDWAIGVSAIVSPVALIWMVAAYLQRAADIQSVAEPLRRQLSLITGESGAAEARIRRFNQAIREQIELLKNAQGISQNDLAAIMDRVRHHRDELERFEHASVLQVKDIQEIVRRNMQQVEQLMDDKFTMLRVLDGKLVQNGDAVARQTEAVRDQIAGLLEEIESHSGRVAETLERATADSKKLADTSRAQEASLTGAAESVAETLNGLSTKIDLSVARFLERTGTAREEAERLAGALDAQTRSLDEFSSTLPTRVSEAESVIRGVADRLYSSELLAREQAVSLSEKLSEQVDGLQSFMDRFTARLTDIDTGLAQRRNDLDSLAGRIGDTTGEFVKAWEKSIYDLSDRTDTTLERFSTINVSTRQDADAVIARLDETTTKYESAALRVNKLAEDSGEQFKAITSDITTQLSQFEALSEAAKNAGVEVESRASGAMQNLQYVLERLLTAREATQSVGETLVKDLYAAVDQNEHLISRLSEAAQMSVHALGVAGESLSKQEDDLSDRAVSAEQKLKEAAIQLQQQAEIAEQGLRRQAEDMKTLLHETEMRIGAAELKMQSLAQTAVIPVQEAVRQIDASADQGLQTLTRYGEGLDGQLTHLQRFHSDVGGMGDRLGQLTVETLASIEQLNDRFIIVRSAQQETARQTLEQFAEFSDRLQREVTGLEGNSSSAVMKLQQAAAQVGEQSYNLMQNAENSSAKMKMVTSALQTEANQIRAILQKQSDDLEADLNRAEKQFGMLTETMQQRTDTVHALLERVVTHYNESTRTTSDTIEARAARFGEVATDAQDKAGLFATSLAQQITAVTSGAGQIETQTAQIAQASNKALQQLSALNEKLSITGETANTNARQIATRLEETGTAFLRQSNSLSDAAQSTTTLIQKAGTAFTEQSGKLLDASQHIDQTIRQLTATTSSLADQSAQIRTSMEQQNQRLIADLTQSVTQLEATSRKLEQTSSTATLIADQTTVRFADMTQSASARLSANQEDMQAVAGKAEATLGIFSAGVTQQSASLALLTEQLSEQYKMLAAANDSQRTQLVDLFEKLGGAHGQASEVAERTIARLSDSLANIQRYLGSLSDQSQAAIGNVRAASTGFADQAALLIQNAQSAEQQARTVMSVTTTLQEQARQLRETMEGESDRAANMIGGLLSKLTAGSVDIRSLSSSAEASLTGLNSNMSEQSQALTGVMQQITDRQRSLTTALDAQREVLNGLLNRLVVAQDETASVAERTASRLTEGTQQITRQTETIESQSRHAMESVQAAGSIFADESSQLIKNAQNAEQQARTVVSVTSSLQDQARQLREAMQVESERAADMLGGLLGKLSSGSADLRTISATAETSLGSLNTNIGEHTQSLTSSMQQISDRQRSLTTALDAQRDVLNGLLGRLTVAQDETAAVAERTATRLTEGTQQITRQAEVIESQSRHAMESVQAAGAGFADESSQLIQNAQNAEQQARTILSVTAALQEQARQHRDVMQVDADRAGEALTALLNRIAAGGRDLRDMSANAEMSLGSLHNGVNQQTIDLGAMIQQIVDRQRSLTTALDAQRDVLNGLFSRLNLAQDETAAVTERTATRMVESAQQVVRQTEIIEAKAQSALTGVQAASSGFADQAGMLGMQSQQAEQHMRGILSVTAGLQDQARQLREAMQTETARAVEQLNTTIAQLDATNGQLKQQSSSAIHTMDQTALQYATLAKTSAEAMNHQAGVLSETVELAETRVERAGEKMRGHLKLVSDVGEQAEVQARNLADVAEYATGRLVTLRETIIDSDRDGQNVLAQTSARIADVKATLQAELERLSELSNHAVQQVALATQGIVTQNDTLRSNLAMSESAMIQAADLVREEAVRVPSTLDRSTSQIEQATRVLKAQTEEADSILVGTADRFISVTMTARESMIEEMRSVSTTAEQADRILRGFNESLTQQMKSIHVHTAQMSDEQRELVEKAHNSVAELAAASDRMANLRNDATATAEKLAREFDVLDQRATSTGERLSAAGETVMKNVDALAQVTQRAESQMLGASSQFRDQLERIRAGLQGQIDDINRGLMQITAQLERTGNTLRSTTAGTVADVERIAQRFDQTSKDASTHLTDKTARMRGATEEVAKLLAGFGDQLDVLLDRLALAGDGLRRQEGGLVDQLQNALTHLGTVSERLEVGRHLAASVSEETSARLGGVIETVQREMQNLTSGSQAAAGIMRGIGQIYGEQTQALNKGVRDAHGQVLEMNKSVDEMQQRTDRLRVSLKLQSDELMISLQQILKQLSQTGDALGDTVDDVLSQQAADNLKKIG
jgi:hypothetical protein